MNEALQCPNPACPFVARFGYPAEYRADIASCSDCGAKLVIAGASVALAAPQADIGPIAPNDIRVPHAADQSASFTSLTVGGFSLLGFFLRLPAFDTKNIIMGFGGAALVAASWKLRAKAVDGVIERGERGFRYRRGATSWAVHWSDIDSAVLTQFGSPSLGVKALWQTVRFRLMMKLKNGEHVAIEALFRGPYVFDDPFLAFARSLESAALTADSTAGSVPPSFLGLS